MLYQCIIKPISTLGHRLMFALFYQQKLDSPPEKTAKCNLIKAYLLYLQKQRTKMIIFIYFVSLKNLPKLAIKPLSSYAAILQTSSFKYTLFIKSIIILSSSSMNCPKCKVNFLRYEEGALCCTSDSCLYCDMHPISYENDVVQFDGQGGQNNRYSSLFHPCYDNGGSMIGRESYFDSNFKRAKKMINDCCHVLKLSQHLADVAESRCYKILKILFKLKMENTKEDKKDKHRNYYSVKNIAFYSIFSSCFEMKNYFEEFNICKFGNISLSSWKDVVRELNNFLKDKIEFIPVTMAKHVLLRVCRRRKIRAAEERAMIEMSQRIYASGEFDIRNNTIAAISFWKVCEYSNLYTDQINLNECCKNHEKMIEDGVRQSQIWKCFDVTPENVRKVFKESISARLNDFLPVWQGRIVETKKEQL